MAGKKKNAAKRYITERADLYFRRKFSGAVPVLLAAAIISVLYALLEGGGGPMYFIVAAMFVGLAVWQFFYTRRAEVRGEEVDARAAKVRGEINLDKRALNATKLDIDDFEALDKVILYGYTTLPIDKAPPLLRADPQDGVGRSSHLQVSRFILGDDFVEVFTVIRSLLDSQETQENVMWRFDHIDRISLEDISVPCARESGGQETVNRNFPVIAIRGSNRQARRTYAFSEDCRAEGEELVRMIQEEL